MGETAATRPSLLVRIRDARDGDAWRQFLDAYAPLIYGFARNRGLQDADAADLMQDVLRAVARAAGRLQYDPGRGTFRSWLYTVTRSKLNTFLARQRRQAIGSGGSGAQERLEEQPGPGQDDWDETYGRRVFDWAAGRVRGAFAANVWQAFWQTAVEGKPAREVAPGVGMTVGSVYVAKSRVLARIRDEVRRLEEA